MRRANISSAILVALVLAGCGSGEAAQRTAFVEFLKTRVLDKPGVHVPQLTDDERTSFGHYADDYVVISDFNKTLNESVSPRLKGAMTTGSITSLEDVVTRRTQLEAARTAMTAMAGALGGDLARADAAHAKLDQPAEVKAVYDKAYDRLVTQPAAALKGVSPVMNTVLGQAIELSTYIDAHRSAVQLSGSSVATSDPAVRSGLNDRLQKLQASQQLVQAAQRRMQLVVYGAR